MSEANCSKAHATSRAVLAEVEGALAPQLPRFPSAGVMRTKIVGSPLDAIVETGRTATWRSFLRFRSRASDASGR